MNKYARAVSLYIGLFGLLGFFYSGHGQNQMKGAKKSPFLWETSINGARVLLCGTLHCGRPDDYPLPDYYQAAYRLSDCLILEIATPFSEVEDKLFEFASDDRLPVGQRLSDHLKPETQAVCIDLIGEEKFQRCDAYAGWILQMSIMANKVKRVGFDPQLGIDRYFMRLALEDNKPVLGFESVEKQVGMFRRKMDIEQQITLLENLAWLLEPMAKRELPMYEAYYDQDEDRFESAFLTSYDMDNPALKGAYERIFASRNALWVDQLETFVKDRDQTYMVLVGSGHFFGPDNLRDLLIHKGHEVMKPEL